MKNTNAKDVNLKNGYNSGDNDKFLSISELKELIKHELP